MASILAVDDSATIRQMVSFTLRSAGHTVTDACDGKQALDLIRLKHFDLVLTDINMPIIDGLNLTRELRQLPVHRLTPILILTNESSQDRKQEGRKAGATGWLVKPFNPDQLLTTIKKVLG